MVFWCSLFFFLGLVVGLVAMFVAITRFNSLPTNEYLIRREPLHQYMLEFQKVRHFTHHLFECVFSIAEKDGTLGTEEMQKILGHKNDFEQNIVVSSCNFEKSVQYE